MNESINTKVCSYFCSDIYSLYHIMNNDPGLDLFSLLKEKDQNSATLSGISKESVSEVYLLFDYDGHATAASDEKLKALLSHFDEETENGKLYISYPMVEALKHLHSAVSFQTVVVKGKENINYKSLVHTNSDSCYRDLATLNRQRWNTILSEHCKKINYLMTGSFTLPSSVTTQMKVFEKQEEKHITPRNEVAVLSAFPILIADYYGYSRLPSLVLEV